MEIAKIKVSGATASAEKESKITAGMVGVTVRMQYADIWDGLHKTVVFRAGTVTKDVITDDEVVTVPKEVVAAKDVQLYVGVYGVDAEGNLVIPTIWAGLGRVMDAADPSGDAETDPSLPVWAKIQAMIGDLDALDTAAKNNLVAAVNEALTRGGGDVNPAEIQRIVEEYLAANPPQFTETDPTVPAWAKQPQKPTYTAEEVHALPDTYTPPDQTAQQVGADPAGTAATAVSQHNTDAAAHNDLRLALQELANRVNAALDSDDTTLDQMSEVVAYIKSNKSLIDAITTSKVSVGDIINDLVTNAADKPLSAAQGVALKRLIDELSTIADDVDKKLDKPDTPPTDAGKVLRVLSVNEDGTFTCEWADAPSGGITDVQLNGNSVVSDGVANIPFAGERSFTKGTFAFHPNYGLDVASNSRFVFGLRRWDASVWDSFRDGQLHSGRGRDCVGVSSDNADYAVKTVLCDGKGDTWTDVERIAALLRMGCTVDDNGFVKWTAQEVTE